MGGGVACGVLLGQTRQKQGQAFGRGVVAQQRVKTAAGQFQAIGQPEQPGIVMQRQDVAVNLEHELLRIGVGLEMSHFDRLNDGAAHRVVPGLDHGDQRIAHRARAVVEFDRAGDVDAAGLHFHAHPLQPALHHGRQTRHAARLLDGAVKHLLLELVVIVADNRDLQLFARTEMREYP